MSTYIRWGILGAANFARKQMVPAIHAARYGALTAIATRHAAKAQVFVEFAPDLRVYDDYDSLLADPEIDAVYIPLPNHLHVAQTKRAVKAGKHVLSEKPIAMRASYIDELIQLRDRSGLMIAEAMQTYAHFLKDFHVLPIYGGQSYTVQLRHLDRGVQVVGTPGRIMDHMRRGTLKLNNLIDLVLDEADEMLRMGFIDDINWILEHTPDKCQIALFSATIPAEIRPVADQHLKQPKVVKIKSKTTTAANIRQRFFIISVNRPQ